MVAVIAPGLHATRYWHALSDGRVQCDVCPRRCRLREGQRGLCFVAHAPGRCRRPHHLRALQRVLRRPDREEAAQPLPPRDRRALVRDGRAATSPASSARTGTSPRRGSWTRWPTPRRPRSSPPRPSGSAAAASPSPTTTRSSSSSTPSTRAVACRARGIKTVAVTAGYVCPEPRAELFAHLAAANIDLKSFNDDFYRTSLRRAARARARDARVRPPRDAVLARGHDPRDSGPERLGRGARRADTLGRRPPGRGRAAPLQRLPPRPPVARPAADTRGDAPPRPGDRTRERGAPCVRRERPRPRGRDDVLPRVRRAADRQGRIRDRGLATRRLGVLPPLWDRLRGRASSRIPGTGAAPPAGADRAHERANPRTGRRRGLLPGRAGRSRRPPSTACSRRRHRATGSAPHAIVVPHAGYVYSGPVAAVAYRAVEPRAAEIRQVVLLGPPHYVPLEGAAVSAADAWTTPLGVVPVAGDLRVAALRAGADPADLPHAPEHSLEVQLPFLQRVLRHGFSVLPVVVGEMRTDAVADLVAALWGGSDTLVVVSTDLSHYLDDASGARADRDDLGGDHGPAPGGDRGRGGLRLARAARPRRARPQGRSHDRAPRARHVGGHVRRPLAGGRLRSVRGGRVEARFRPRASASATARRGPDGAGPRRTRPRSPRRVRPRAAPPRRAPERRCR